MPLDVKSLMDLADICRKAAEDAVAPIVKENKRLVNLCADLEDKVSGLEKRVTGTNKGLEMIVEDIAKLPTKEAIILALDLDKRFDALPSKEAILQDLDLDKRFAALGAKQKQMGEDLSKRLDDIQLTPGPKGEKGEKGEKGVAPSEDEIAKMVGENVENILPSFIPDPIPGPQGPQGEKGDTPDVTELVEEGIVRIERSVMKQLPEMIPEPVPGPQGLPGPKGEKGADGLPGPQGAKGDTPEAIPPNDLQVIEAVKAIYPSIRADVLKSMPKIEHKGVHEAGEEYGAGDEVIKNDSTYRAKHTTRETPPHDDWQCIAKSKTGRRGPQGDAGEPGAKGDPGKDGVGFDDLITEDGKLFFARSDGEVNELDFSQIVADAVAKFMIKGEDK